MSDEINKASGEDEAKVEAVTEKESKPKVSLDKQNAELRKEVKELKAELRDLARAVSRTVPRNGNVQRLVKKYL